MVNKEQKVKTYLTKELFWFYDGDNYIGHVIHNISKDYKEINERLFWKINGKRNQLDISQQVVSAFYRAMQNQIIIATVSSVWILCPLTQKIEKIEFPNGNTIYQCNMIDNKKVVLLLLVLRANTVCCDFISIDLDSHNFTAIQMPDIIRGVVSGSNGTYYYAVSENGFYRIENVLVEKFKEHNCSSIFLWDKWPNDSLIVNYEDQNIWHIMWDNTILCHRESLLSARRIGKYLWVIEKNGEVRIYDYFGVLNKSFNLEMPLVSLGNTPNDNLWFFYSNDSVDIFDEKATLLEKTNINGLE